MNNIGPSVGVWGMAFGRSCIGLITREFNILIFYLQKPFVID